MGWVRNKINSWSSSKQIAEMSNFVAMLRGMDGAELGYVVAIATHMRHALESKGHDVMDPIVYTSKNPMFPLFLSRTIEEAQRQGRTQDAAALMVWAHTHRAGVRLELRTLAREMWRQLQRGFPYVVESAAGSKKTIGTSLNILGATSFPVGFTPEPL